MVSTDELASFIATSFRSIWALELLLLLKREGGACSHDDLVDLMRASPTVVQRALDSLVAAGTAGLDGEKASYMPASAQIAQFVDETERLYRTKPDRVRRLIVDSAHRGLTAFSDAFRLKD